MRHLLSIGVSLRFWPFSSGFFSGKCRKIASHLARIPALILVFIFIDVSLGLGYIVNELIGHPYSRLTVLLDLNGEGNLPTWYSSIQWFCVATFLGLFAYSNFRIGQRRSWLLPVLALFFLAFSVDEVARIHEWLGNKTDVLLPDGSRANTPLPETGIWMFVIGVPVLAVFGWLIFSIRMYFHNTPNALMKVFAGLLITLSGALGFEILKNFVAPASIYGILQVFSEEFSEMLGGTIVLWGSYELLLAHGFAYSLASVHLEFLSDEPSHSQPSRDKSERKRLRSNRRSRAA
jgi:hypothetical protein